MITAQSVFAKLEEFHDFIDEMAETKAKLDLMESQTKSVKADLMLRSGKTSNNAQETWALASEEYKNHLQAVAHYSEKYEQYRLRRDYIMALNDSWRTLESSRRAIERGAR